MTDDTQFDPFEDETTSAGEGTSFEDDTNTGSEPTGEDDDTNAAEPTGEEGAEEEGQSAEGTEEGKQSEKLIPESRLKAAIKDMQGQLEKANAELAKYTAVQAPDPNTQPEEHVKWVRLETSKRIMSQTHDDYQEVIRHFQSMAAEHPFLNDQVANHEMPAKFAYDLAKRDMELRELTEMRNSDEWKEFQEFKKAKSSGGVAQGQNTAAQLGTKAPSIPKVPTNLNKATSVNRAVSKSEDDDELFAGAL